MTSNVDTFYTKLKCNFDTMDKYRENKPDQEKVSTLLENICKVKQKLESVITFLISNHNGN